MAASWTASGLPTNVYTVRLVSAPGSTSSRLAPPTPLMASAMASITARFRPSEKLGTHSTSLGIRAAYDAAAGGQAKREDHGVRVSSSRLIRPRCRIGAAQEVSWQS